MTTGNDKKREESDICLEEKSYRFTAKKCRTGIKIVKYVRKKIWCISMLQIKEKEIFFERKTHLFYGKSIRLQNRKHRSVNGKTCNISMFA